jgi:CHASE2 domain-containing sensor protein
MMKVLFALVVGVFFACNSKKVYREVSRTDKIDQDIVLINISNSDRSEIAALLLDIEKCKPLIVGIDVIFLKHKQLEEDSILSDALGIMNNDILAYEFDSQGNGKRSIDEFRKVAYGEGYVNLDERDEIASHFTPVKEVNGKLYESFALIITKHWRPKLKYDLTVNKSIPILFQRSQQQYYYFEKEDLMEKAVCELLKNKIVLVGYLGPEDEDKYYTPIRSNDKDQVGKSDTYGLVIQANAIRTILEYGRKD